MSFLQFLEDVTDADLEHVEQYLDMLVSVHASQPVADSLDGFDLAAARPKALADSRDMNVNRPLGNGRIAV